jgi:hypothetical protein
MRVFRSGSSIQIVLTTMLASQKHPQSKRNWKTPWHVSAVAVVILNRCAVPANAWTACAMNCVSESVSSKWLSI